MKHVKMNTLLGIQREALASTAPLTVITAPEGSGKTRALVEVAKSSEQPVIFVTEEKERLLKEYPNDTVRDNCTIMDQDTFDNYVPQLSGEIILLDECYAPFQALLNKNNKLYSTMLWGDEEDIMLEVNLIKGYTHLDNPFLNEDYKEYLSAKMYKPLQEENLERVVDIEDRCAIVESLSEIGDILRKLTDELS